MLLSVLLINIQLSRTKRVQKIIENIGKYNVVASPVLSSVHCVLSLFILNQSRATCDREKRETEQGSAMLSSQGAN